MAHGRLFDGSDDFITLALGNCGVAFGPSTVAAIVKRNSLNDNVVIGGFTDAAQTYAWRFGLFIDTADDIFLDLAGSGQQSSPTINVLNADNWVLIAVTKDTGTVTPRFHRYKYDTSTWTHENAGGTLANSATVTNKLQIGRADTFFWGGDVLIAGFWNEVLSDGTLEGLTDNAQAWIDSNPDGLWFLNQSSVATDVEDVTGGGADQTAITGTTVGTNDLADFSFGPQVEVYGYYITEDGNGRYLLEDESGFYLIEQATAGEPFPSGYIEAKPNTLVRM